MNRAAGQIMGRVLVARFYRQHAGVFLFFFLLFFGIVAPSQQVDYHYRLMMGILETPVLLVFVLLGWGVYFGWSLIWIRRRLARDDYRFLLILPGGLDKRRLQWISMAVQLKLLAPVTSYGLVVAGVGVAGGYAAPVLVVLSCLTAMHLTGGRLMVSWISERPFH